MITPYISEEHRKKSFPVRTLFSQVNHDNDVFFQKYTFAEILEAYMKQDRDLLARHQEFQSVCSRG